MTPQLQLELLFVLEAHGRIVSTREPNARPGPRFTLIRGRSGCAWGVRADVPDQVAAELDRLARAEPPLRDFADPPIHAATYQSILGGQGGSGPAFEFPEVIPQLGEAARVDELRLLERHFRGWTADEIPERSPILAIMENGYPVSICFCARKSENAAEAGVDTAEAFRGRGLAPRVTAAWATAIRGSGRVPLYSTSDTNTASLAVARKLGLVQYAVDWNLG